MDKELQDLKSMLRSLVVSSPAQVDVRSLVRDYRSLMGAPIPLAKYGYKDVPSFLKERCADCFLGPPSNPVLTLIVPDSLKHIDKFVQRQKCTAITKMKGKRRSVETPTRPPEKSKFDKPTNMICQTFQKKHISTQNLIHQPPEMKSNNQAPGVKSTNHTLEVKTNSHPPTEKSNSHPSAEKSNYHTPKVKPNCRPPEAKSNNHLLEERRNYILEEDIKITKSSYVSTNNMYNRTTKVSKSPPSAKRENNVNAHPHIEENVYNGKVSNLLKKRLMMYDSSVHLDSEEYAEHDKVSSKGDNDSGRQTSSSQSSTKKAQLEELKCEVHELIKEHENGILCTEILRLYRERYSRELNLSRLGHNNINSLLCSMEERVSFSQEAGGVRVRDAGARARRARAPPAALPPLSRSLRALPVDPDDALPGIDFEPDVFPADCMHFMESIPAPPLEGVAAGAMLQVAVAEVYSPSHFWLQRVGPQHSHAMDDIMDEMLEYYGAGAGRERVLARGAVRPGHYCASLYERDWHRALIVRVLDADTVKVRHVDYGTVDSVAVATLKPLLRRWRALPAQGLRARLAGLRPGAGGRRWPHAAAAHFLHLVRDRQFVANVVAVDTEEDTIETFLIDTSGADDVCVSAELIRAGYADVRGDSALRSGECYLFPRFEALESGATPNYGEIHRYLADGISLEYVDAYRRYVPAALPAPLPASPPSPPPAPASAPLEYVDAYRRYVPAALPVPLPASPPSPPPAPAPLEYVGAYRRYVPTALPTPRPASPPSPPPAPAPLELFNRVPLLRLESPPAAVSAAPSPAASHRSMASVSELRERSPEPASPPPSPSPPAPASTAARPPAPPSAGPSSTPCPPADAPPAVAMRPAPGLAAPAEMCPARGGGGGVRLTLAECDVYTLLNSLDPAAAHCYMLSALHRATAAAPQPQFACPAPAPASAPDPPRFLLNPQAPEFRVGFPQHFGPSPPAFGPTPPAFGPPAPAFGPTLSAFGPSPPAFGPPAPTFGPPQPTFGPPQHTFGPHPPVFGPPLPVFGPLRCPQFPRPPAP